MRFATWISTVMTVIFIITELFPDGCQVCFIRSFISQLSNYKSRPKSYTSASVTASETESRVIESATGIYSARNIELHYFQTTCPHVPSSCIPCDRVENENKPGGKPDAQGKKDAEGDKEWGELALSTHNQRKLELQRKVEMVGILIGCVILGVGGWWWVRHVLGIGLRRMDILRDNN